MNWTKTKSLKLSSGSSVNNHLMQTSQQMSTSAPWPCHRGRTNHGCSKCSCWWWVAWFVLRIWRADSSKTHTWQILALMSPASLLRNLNGLSQSPWLAIPIEHWMWPGWPAMPETSTRLVSSLSPWKSTNDSLKRRIAWRQMKDSLSMMQTMMKWTLSILEGWGNPLGCMHQGWKWSTDQQWVLGKMMRQRLVTFEKLQVGHNIDKYQYSSIFNRRFNYPQMQWWVQICIWFVLTQNCLGHHGGPLREGQPWSTPQC